MSREQTPIEQEHFPEHCAAERKLLPCPFCGSDEVRLLPQAFPPDGLRGYSIDGWVFTKDGTIPESEMMRLIDRGADVAARTDGGVKTHKIVLRTDEAERVKQALAREDFMHFAEVNEVEGMKNE